LSELRAQYLEEQFDTLEQQHESCVQGMWLFLVTEVLFFGGLIFSYIVYRYLYPHEFAAGSRLLLMPLGAANTGVLLCSSLTMALAVHAAQTGHRAKMIFCLLLTMALGAAFLSIKGFEYATDWREGLIPGEHFTYANSDPRLDSRKVELFFYLYFAMTGLHAIHMLVGVGVLGALTVLAWRGRIPPQKYTSIELAGLYWHFVDIVWIFLFPMLYMIGHH
jgi:cytochrome c oxidase subunit 3